MEESEIKQYLAKNYIKKPSKQIILASPSPEALKREGQVGAPRRPVPSGASDVTGDRPATRLMVKDFLQF